MIENKFTNNGSKNVIVNINILNNIKVNISGKNVTKAGTRSLYKFLDLGYELMLMMANPLYVDYLNKGLLIGSVLLGGNHYYLAKN